MLSMHVYRTLVLFDDWGVGWNHIVRAVGNEHALLCQLLVSPPPLHSGRDVVSSERGGDLQHGSNISTVSPVPQAGAGCALHHAS